MLIKTKFLILSDTHGFAPLSAEKAEASSSTSLPSFKEPLPCESIDVVLHCGDLTTNCTTDELQRTMDFLAAHPAPLKLCIPGNHDRYLDEAYAGAKRASKRRGSVGAEDKAAACRAIVESANGVKMLSTGTHTFELANGASLRIYADPYTPEFGHWGFQYPKGTRTFDIPNNVDVVMTHGPPYGVLDEIEPVHPNDYAHVGCKNSLWAVYRAKPQIHCFGHIHEDWGACLATWGSSASEVDIASSEYIVRNQEVWPKIAFDRTERTPTHQARVAQHRAFPIDTTEGETELAVGQQTLFLNAAMMDEQFKLNQAPFIVDINLPSCSAEASSLVHGQ